MKILVAEDEPKVQRFVTQALKEAGMTVDPVSNISDLLSCLQTYTYEVLVLDRLLRGKDAVDFLKEIRQAQPHLKILILSALSELEDKVKGLTEGADDYLSKPFHVAELIARIRSLARREISNAQEIKSNLVYYLDLKIDLEKQIVTRQNQKIELSAKEFKLITLLARHPGRIFSKSQLLDEVWDMNHFPESNVVEVTVANLRAKLDRGFTPLVNSKRGVGYWLGTSE